MAKVLLTNTNINSGNPVYVLAKEIDFDYKKSNSGKPQANYDTDKVPRRVSGNFDVPKYTIQCTLQESPATIDSTTVMTQTLLKEFLAAENTDSDPTTLNIAYDGGQWTSLQQVSGSYQEEIPVTFDSVRGKIDSRFRDGQKPTYTIVLEEVQKVV